MARSDLYSARQHSPRLLLPITLVNVIVVLLEEVIDQPSPVRVELLNALRALQRAYRLPALANQVELEQTLREIDGIPFEDEGP